MIEKIVVPVLGESITEATVSKWLKKEGDNVEVDEPIVELETDKVNLEVPSPISGVLTEISSKDGSVVAEFADLTLTFSAGSKAGGNFNTSNSANASVWPNSGSWTFDGGDKNKLKRNDNVVMTISLTNNDNDLKVSFNVASGVKQGNWVFDFVKK